MKSSAALVTVLVAISAMLATTPIAEAFEPSDILTSDAQTPMWEGITAELWSGLTNGCDNIARTWWRMVFHDCGTYDKDTRTGGCDGSLKHELDRKENEDFPHTISFYETVIDNWAATAEEEEPTASMADVIIAGGLLALKMCRGPTVRFTPYRKDAMGPNGAGLLPGRFDDANTILAKMRRASFNTQQSVVLIGAGHTIAFNEKVDRLDATPDKFDNKFFVEMKDEDLDGKLESDVAMMNSSEMKNWITFFARNGREFTKQSVKNIEKMINLIPEWNDEEEGQWEAWQHNVKQRDVAQHSAQASA